MNAELCEIALRPATPEDEEFLRRVYASTRADEMALVDWNDQQKDDFLSMQFHAQHTFYHAEFPNAAYDILLNAGRPIGRLYVDRRSDEIRVLDIALLPEFRDAGIGTTLIQSIMDEAAASDLPVTLHVETFNRAQRLYDRLGFVRVQNDGLYLLMKWTHTHASA